MNAKTRDTTDAEDELNNHEGEFKCQQCGEWCPILVTEDVPYVWGCPECGDDGAQLLSPRSIRATEGAS